MRVDKLDILFVVDNSINMGPKQPYLASAAAELVDRLANPSCVEGEDSALADGCPEGQQREFAPVLDMHLGVISSSLGSHGGTFCGAEDPTYNPTKNDAGKLMASVRDGLTSYRDLGFLAWDAQEVDDEAEHDLADLKAAVSAHILSVGETGCAYEAPLEALYRFLIDPSPPKEIVVTADALAYPAMDDAGKVLLDMQVLEQRAYFLRPDSALVIVLLSDEDDCSIRDSGRGWLAAVGEVNGMAFKMPRATAVCDVDPNNPCCRSCNHVESSPPDGCVPLDEDAACSERTNDTDSMNLRCFDQKRRFGMDLLYPVDRYVSGLTKTRLEDPWSCSEEECPLVPNPLFPPEQSETSFTRRASEVFVVSLVGVPWQDLATSDSLSGEELTYKRGLDADDWNLVIGSPSNYIAPQDPLMIASPNPRSGIHPVTGEPVAPADSTDPRENSINGHEFANLNNDWLQYACTFPLVSPKDCSNAQHLSCECTHTELARNKPLCQPPTGGEAMPTQYFTGATPGLRQLELMSKLPRAVPASICPKVVDGNASGAAYGYNPAMRALVHELRSVLE